MREIVFRVVQECPGYVEACNDERQLRISAPSQEELHHEAREALIQHLGPVHAAYRIRLCRRGREGGACLPRRGAAPANAVTAARV